MNPGNFYLNILFLIFNSGVEAFHVEKPRTYINFFDEVVIDQVNSNFTGKDLSPAVPLNNSTKDAQTKTNLLSNFTIFPHDHNTTALELNVSPDGDIPFRTDTSFSESNLEYPTTMKFEDVMDPEFVENEMTRLFFLRAIASLIEHIMTTLFSVEDAPKVTEPPMFDYEMPTRNLKKRDLSDPKGIKKNDKELTPGHLSEPKTSGVDTFSVGAGVQIAQNTTHLMTEKNISNSLIASSLKNDSESIVNNENSLGNLTEHDSHTPTTTLVSEHHSSSNHSNHDTTVEKTHANPSSKVEKENIENLRHKMEAFEKSVSNAKLINEETEKILTSSLLNDEVISKKDFPLYGGAFPADDQGGKLSDQNTYTSSGLILTAAFSTTVLLLFFLGAMGLAGYLFRKYQAQSTNQNVSNSHHTVVA